MLGRTVSELERTVSAAELTDWRAFDRLYTLPDAYFVVGQVCSVLSGVFSGKSLNPSEFVPFFRPPKARRQTPAEMRSIMRERLDAARIKKQAGRV